MSEATFFLLRYGLFFALLLHLPYAGLVAAGSAVSLVANALGRDKGREELLRFSREAMAAVPLSPAILPLFGGILLGAVALLSRRILGGADPLGWPFWVLAALFFLAGAVLLRRYRAGLALPPERQGRSARLGAAGLTAAATALFLVSVGQGVLLDPEKLDFVAGRPIYLLSWHAFVRFLVVLALSFGIAGGAILLVREHPAEGKEEERTPEFHRYAVTRAALTALLAALPVPVLVVLHLATLPDVALSWGVVGLSASMLIIALAASVSLYLSVKRGEGRSGRPAFVSHLLIFLIFLLGDYVALGNAYEGRGVPPVVTAAAAEPAAEKAGSDATARGKAVFERSCSACHRFDARVVGPPLAEAVPKYAGDVEKLKAFIRSPVKVRPDYPAMPSLGLPEEEIDAVARYLIAEAGGGRRR